MDRLKRDIENQLPQNTNYDLIYIQTKPTYVKPLVNARKSSSEQPSTIKIRHFFSLIETTKHTILFGIEILVYLTIKGTNIEQNIFVSKCDTVGLFQHKVRVGLIVKVILRWLISFDLRQYKLKRKPSFKEVQSISSPIHSNIYDVSQIAPLPRLERIANSLTNDPGYYSSIPFYNSPVSKKMNTSNNNSLDLPQHQTIKLSLFTKAARQYLFPNSFKNQHKHVIGGAQLLEWWLRIIDTIFIHEELDQCRLSIPGLADQPTTKFFNGLHCPWTVGNIFDTDPMAVYNIPLFPDDPKGRFLEHLIVENNYRKMDNDRFYEELGYRQEFRLGEVVGLIGAEQKNVSISKNSPNHEVPWNVISLKDYKQFVNLIKSEHYNIESDVRELVVSKIPEFFSTKNLDNEIYLQLWGTGDIETQPKKSTVVVNSLTVTKRSNDLQSSRINNLTGLVKRKKKNEVE